MPGCATCRSRSAWSQLYLNQSRAEVIVPALKIFTEVLRICRIDTVCVPRMGLADGIIHQLYRQYNPFA